MCVGSVVVLFFFSFYYSYARALVTLGVLQCLRGNKSVAIANSWLPMKTGPVSILCAFLFLWKGKTSKQVCHENACFLSDSVPFITSQILRDHFCARPLLGPKGLNMAGRNNREGPVSSIVLRSFIRTSHSTPETQTSTNPTLQTFSSLTTQSSHSPEFAREAITPSIETPTNPTSPSSSSSLSKPARQTMLSRTLRLSAASRYPFATSASLTQPSFSFNSRCRSSRLGPE